MSKSKNAKSPPKVSSSAEDESLQFPQNPYLPADFTHWAKLPFWTPVELACVTLGFAPDPLMAADLAALQVNPEDFRRVSNRARLAQRSIEMGHLPEKVTPTETLIWLEAIEEEFPDELFDYVSATPRYGDGKIIPCKDEQISDLLDTVSAVKSSARSDAYSANPSSHTKHLQTLEKLTLAMSVRGYGYEPNCARSDKYGEIANDAASLGIDLHVDTVRKHIKRAAANHWEEPQD